MNSKMNKVVKKAFIKMVREGGKTHHPIYYKRYMAKRT